MDPKITLIGQGLRNRNYRSVIEHLYGLIEDLTGKSGSIKRVRDHTFALSETMREMEIHTVSEFYINLPRVKSTADSDGHKFPGMIQFKFKKHGAGDKRPTVHITLESCEIPEIEQRWLQQYQPPEIDITESEYFGSRLFFGLCMGVVAAIALTFTLSAIQGMFVAICVILLLFLLAFRLTYLFHATRMFCMSMAIAMTLGLSIYIPGDKTNLIIWIIHNFIFVIALLMGIYTNPWINEYDRRKPLAILSPDPEITRPQLPNRCIVCGGKLTDDGSFCVTCGQQFAATGETSVLKKPEL